MNVGDFVQYKNEVLIVSEINGKQIKLSRQDTFVETFRNVGWCNVNKVTPLDKDALTYSKRHGYILKRTIKEV